MQTLIDNMRLIIGTPSFYNAQGVLDYGAVMEYAFASILCLVVVSSVFKLIVRWFD